MVICQTRIKGVDAEVEGGQMWQSASDLVHVSAIDECVSMMHSYLQSELFQCYHAM